MKKSVIALALVFALIFSLAACGKEKTDNGKSTSAAPTASSDALSTTSAGILTPEDLTLSDEEKELMTQAGITEDFSNMIDNEEAATLVVADGPVTGEEKPIEVNLDENGQPTQDKGVKKWNDIISDGKFTMELVCSDDATTVVPLTLISADNKIFVEARVPITEDAAAAAPNSKVQTIKCGFLNDGSNFYLLIPSLKLYLNAGEGTVGDLIPDTSFLNNDKAYTSSAEVEIDGKTYVCHHYNVNEEGADGTTLKYYFLNDDLKRIEVCDDTETVTIFDIVSVSEDVNESKLKLPTNYADLTALVDADNFDLGSLMQ